MNTLPEAKTIAPEFLSGGGEMGQHIRDYDWSSTSLGQVDQWPQSLRSVLSICLNSNFPIAIYWGQELTLIYNDAWSPIPGNKHPWSLGRPAKEVWPEIWDAIEPQFEKAFQGMPGGSKDALLPMQRHGYTEECYFDFTFTPVYGEGGKVEGVFNAVIETTYRVINERRTSFLKNLALGIAKAQTTTDVLVKAIQFIKGASEDIPFALLYSNTDQQASFVASTTGTELSFRKRFPLETIDQSGFPLHIKDLKEYLNNIPQSYWPEEPKEGIIAPLKNSSGVVTAFLVCGLSARRRFDEEYKLFIESLVGAVTSVTNTIFSLEEERKRAEALAEIDRAKTAFFTNISHEFRTPLTLMLGSVEQLLNKHGIEGREETETLKTTHRNAVRLLRLVNNLLDFSRLEDGRVKARFALMDVGALTANLASNFRSAIEGAGLEFHIFCDSSVQPVYVDTEMWEKIVLNLLSNAFKYTLTGGITLSLTTQANAVVLKVTDTGVGIPESELPKMFQRFHRIQNSVGRTFEGTGIGLSLVKELVQLHGGEISVTSKEGVGSEFTVSIPTGKAHLREETTVNANPKDQELAAAFLEEVTFLDDQPLSEKGNDEKKDGYSVLIVDDNADMRRYIKNLLQKDFNVVTANNGMEALHRITEQQPDLVVSDIMMPVMDGIQLLKTIKENPQTQNIPVILLSARAGEEAKIEGLNVGADDYLVKPFSATELLARVAAQLRTSNTRNHIQQQLQNIIMQAPVAMCVLRGPTFIVEVANERVLELWGKTAEQMMNKPVFEAMPDAAGQGFEELLDSVYKTGKPFLANELPVDLIRKGKLEKVFLNFVYEPLHEGNGKISGIVAVATEITEQVIARKKIEESEQKLRIAIEGGELGTYDFYPQTGELSWSKKTKEFFGLPPEAEVDYAIFLKGLHPDDRERSDVAIRKAMDPKSGGLYENEYRTVGLTDGKLRWIKSKGKTTFDDDGNAIRFTGVTQEITIQKETLASLQVQSLVLQRMDEGVSVSDEEGRIIFTNPAEDKMFGYAPGELIGKNVTIQNAYVPEENEKIVAGVIDQLKSKGFWSGEWHNRKKDGTGFYTFSYITSVAVDGKTRFVCVQRDITEEKKTRDALVESEQRFRSLANSIPQLAWMADADGWIMWYNDKWYEFTGTTPEQMEGWGWQSVHHPEKLPEVLHRWKASIASGQPFEMVFPLKRADGKFRQFLTRVLPVVNSEGKIQQWFGTNTDITEQINAEEELKKIKNQLELTFQNVPSAIYHFDKEGKVIYLNERGAKQLGYETIEEALAEKDVFQLRKRLEETFIILNEKGAPMPAEEGSVAICYRTGKAAEVVSQIVHRQTGQSWWYLSNSSPLFNENGELFMVLSTSTDITLQKTSEQAIRQSEERFRTLAETLPQMIWVRNGNGQIEYGSKSWEDYSGIKGVSEAWIAMTHPDDYEPIMKSWKKAAEEGKRFKYEVRLKNKKGEYRWHSAVGEPIKDGDGNVVKWIGALTDVQEQKMLSQKLEKLVAERTRELQRSNEDLQQFAHVASHDLKEPVRKIMTFGNRLKHEFGTALPEKAVGYLSKMESAAIRMYSMIDGVLLYSSLNALEQTKESIELEEILQSVESDLEVLIAQKEATIKYSDMPVIEGSNVLIYQLFYNLINNSLKFSSPLRKPSIQLNATPVAEEEVNRVDLDAARKYVKITLEDNGIGFSNEQAEKIFGTFTRLHSKDKYEGTGLGLSLCKKIVERHGGFISAKGKEGDGSTFELILPLT